MTTYLCDESCSEQLAVAHFIHAAHRMLRKRDVPCEGVFGGQRLQEHVHQRRLTRAQNGLTDRVQRLRKSQLINSLNGAGDGWRRLWRRCLLRSGFFVRSSLLAARLLVEFVLL